MSLATPPKLKKLREALFASAKQSPQRRFHQLYDKMYREDVLQHAYALSRSNDGAPGTDNVTFEDIEKRGLEDWLRELAHELKTESYRPQPVRRTMIAKQGGGERPLGIPTVKDRVVQTAAKLLLEPIFEVDFDDSAHGYRPGRSAHDALKQVHQAIRTGHVDVVDADLSKYFDTIPHAELLKCVARRISDGKMLHLIKMWLKTPAEEKDDRGNRRMTGGKNSTMGTPQGGVLSPLLANIYMHRFIKAFRQQKIPERYGAVLVNYADDFVILCRRNANQVLKIIEPWFNRIGLTLNEKKTRVCNAWDEFTFLGYTFGRCWAFHGRQYIGATPSKKALLRLKEKVAGKLNRKNTQPWPDIADALNRTLRGWSNYFSYGTTREAIATVNRYVLQRARAFLRRRHKLLSRGTRVFPPARIYGELGIIALK